MSDTAVSGYPDIFGKHGVWVGDHTGPASYVTGGETIGAPNAFGGANRYGLRSVDLVVAEQFSHSGNYAVEVLSPVGSGGSANSRVLRWSYNPPGAIGVPLTLGALSAAATLSAMTANGVVTVTGANTLKAGQFVLLTNGATAVGIFLNGAIVQITSATATTYTFNFAAAKSLNYASAADTLKYQVLYGGATNNPVTLGAASGQSIAVTAVAVASNVLTITCVNTGTAIVPGVFIVLQGLAAGEVPQGAIVQVLTANTTTITANLIAPNLGATSNETATATVLVTNGNAPIQASQDAYTISGTTVAATAATSSAAGAITVLPVTQTLAPGNIVVVQGLTHGSALNGLITAVLAASLTATNLTTNGYIASAVTTGSSDLGSLGLLTTGAPVGNGEVAPGTNLAGETVRMMVVGG
jgi:hypothetical protein